jgi:hypothetical protein
VIRLGTIFCYVEEHRRDGVGELVGGLARGAQVFFQSRPRIGERSFLVL